MEHRIVLRVHGTAARWEQFAITLTPQRAGELVGLIETLDALIVKGFLAFELRFLVTEGQWFMKSPFAKSLAWDSAARTELSVRPEEVVWKAYLGTQRVQYGHTSPISKKQLIFFAGIAADGPEQPKTNGEPASPESTRRPVR